MNVWNAKQDKRFGRRGTVVSLAVHALAIVLLALAPTLGMLPDAPDPSEVRLVRLKGGGELKPGWINPTPAAADDAIVPDNKPQAPDRPKPEPAPDPEPAPAEDASGVTMADEQEPDAREPEDVVSDEPEPDPEADPEPQHSKDDAGADDPPVDETEGASGDAEPDATPPPDVETGAGVGAKPGPEGEGVGATTDADFAGASAYLSRIEAEVQRRFNYRGNAPGRVAVYRFTIDRSGTIDDLVMDQSSGLPSLDLSARSALLRAKLPPLPRTYPYARLGVTYRFYGD